MLTILHSVILLTFLGPEYLGRKFGVAFDHDMAEVSGPEAYAAVGDGGGGAGLGRRRGGERDLTRESSEDGEKGGGGVGMEKV